MNQPDPCALQVGWIDSPVGVLRAGVSDSALHVLQFTSAKHAPQSVPASGPETPILAQTRRELAEYFAGTRRTFGVPVRARGTSFQERVWKALCDIPYGEWISYLEQSRMIGDEKAIRAVAQANGQNPIVILIPCHRVINTGGQLGGFGGGLLRKQYLLDLERGDRLL